MKFIYPDDLYQLTKSEWKKNKIKDEVVPEFPEKTTFQKMIDVVYHASYLTEESRRIWFRVVYVSKKI